MNPIEPSFNPEVANEVSSTSSIVHEARSKMLKAAFDHCQLVLPGNWISNPVFHNDELKFFTFELQQPVTISTIVGRFDRLIWPESGNEFLEAGVPLNFFSALCLDDLKDRIKKVPPERRSTFIACFNGADNVEALETIRAEEVPIKAAIWMNSQAHQWNEMPYALEKRKNQILKRKYIKMKKEFEENKKNLEENKKNLEENKKKLAMLEKEKAEGAFNNKGK